MEPKAVNENLVVARTLVSGDATTTLVRVINISDKECEIGCDAELGIACEASITLDVSSASSDGDSMEDETTMELADTAGEGLPLVGD